MEEPPIKGNINLKRICESLLSSLDVTSHNVIK